MGPFHFMGPFRLLAELQKRQQVLIYLNVGAPGISNIPTFSIKSDASWWLGLAL